MIIKRKSSDRIFVSRVQRSHPLNVINTIIENAFSTVAHCTRQRPLCLFKALSIPDELFFMRSSIRNNMEIIIILFQMVLL